MGKSDSCSERGNPLPERNGPLFSVSSKGYFICAIPQIGWSYSTGWNVKYLNGTTMRDRSDDPSHHERTLYNGRKKGRVLFKNVLNTFSYGYMASDMVEDHSDSERGSPLPPHGLLFPISRVLFICTIPQTG